MLNISKEKSILLILGSINFVHIIDFMIMMPLGNFLMPFFEISTQKFTTLVSSYAISAGISSFVAAFYVNNFDRKQILLFGFMGFILGTVACGFSPSYEILLICRIMTGVFGGLIAAQVISIIADIIPYERRGEAMGIVMGSFSMASIVGVPLALYLANHFTWQAPFLAIGVLGLILLPFIKIIIPSLRTHIGIKTDELPKMEIIRTIWQNKNQSIALIFSGMMMMGHFLIIPFINPFLEFNVGYPRSFSPLVYLAGGIASLLSARFIGKLADKYGKWVVYRYCVLATFPLIIMITNLTMMPKAIVLMMFGLWFSFSTGRALSAQTLVSNVSIPATRGSYQSFVSFLNQIGMGLASIIAGIVVTKSPTGQLLNYPILGFISVGIMLSTIWLGNKVFRN
jgi:MFS transporter, DHA1 family, inner membrane transport protein